MVKRLRIAGAVLLLLVASVLTQTSASASAGVGWLHSDGPTIKTAEGRPYVIKAVAWFGMETPNCAPHGLWQIGLDDGLARIRSFGFNTVRLPFSNECLHASASTGIADDASPGLGELTPQRLMDRVIERARAHGLQVILDRHRPGSAAQSPLWYTDRVSEADWIADWRMLARRYGDDPTVIGVDLHNEPHGEACWGCGDRARDWAAAATRAGNAVLAENPNLLVIIEGVEQQGDGRSTWWGGGLADVRDHPVRLEIPDRVVYSPHDYPSSIHPQPWFSEPGYPATLTRLWDQNWGYLAREGIAPVLLGEFGTRLESVPDRQWLSTLVDYLDENGMSFAYWSFNPNSGDTGGLVADDWTTPQQAKLDALRPLLDPGAAPAPSPPPTVAAGDLTAEWRLDSGWNGGYVSEVTLRSTNGRSGWTLSYADPDARSVANAWGMSCTVADGRVTCTGEDWATDVPAGGQRVVGLQVSTTGDPPTAPRIDLR